MNDYIIPPHISQENREELHRQGGVRIVNILDFKFPNLDNLENLLKEQEGVLLLLARHGYRIIFKFKNSIWAFPPDVSPQELTLV
jgi:hypothetical protein